MDDVPGKENWSDVFTKSLQSGEDFLRLRDVIMGTDSTLYVSRGVADLIRKGGKGDASNKLVRDVQAWLASGGDES